MTSGFDVWGAVAGVLGLLGLVPLLCGLLKNQLPSYQLKILDEVLSETSSLFRSVCEEGLLKNQRYVAQTELGLLLIHNQTEGYRAEAHRACTLYQEISQWSRGLSREIRILCKEVKNMRASISATSAEERKRLLEEGSAASLHASANVVPPSLGDQSARLQIPISESAHTFNQNTSLSGLNSPSGLNSYNYIHKAQWRPNGRSATSCQSCFYCAAVQPSYSEHLDQSSGASSGTSVIIDASSRPSACERSHHRISSGSPFSRGLHLGDAASSQIAVESKPNISTLSSCRCTSSKRLRSNSPRGPHLFSFSQSRSRPARLPPRPMFVQRPKKATSTYGVSGINDCHGLWVDETDSNNTSFNRHFIPRHKLSRSQGKHVFLRCKVRRKIPRISKKLRDI